VVFQRPRPAEEVLSDWASDIDSVLGLVETTQHLIQKEYLVRGIGGAPAAAAR
jgi:26S proteasome regulatory subunit N5